MGTFLALSAIIGKSQKEVSKVINEYAIKNNGVFNKETQSKADEHECTISEVNGNTAVLYPPYFYKWDECSEYLSRELNATVFSCHIHDGDLWMYVLYNKGEIEDQFNPIPDYWEEISEAAMNEWAGDASVIAKYIPGLDVENISKYLVRWDLDSENNHKAYDDDEFEQEEWQLYDFLRKIGLPLSFDANGTLLGQAYFFKASSEESSSIRPIKEDKKPWWKLW